MNEPRKESPDLESESITSVLQDLSIKNSANVSSCSSTTGSGGSFLKVEEREGNANMGLAENNGESEKSSLSSAASNYSNNVDGGEPSYRSFCPNKPHKGNDIRWEAIQCIKARDGDLGLAHFRLLKKLGFGDIGSVYLAELRGMGCLFAMKVMDKGMLAGRKKLLRAQTEREILGLLDHPFLPTLYSHFETEKFSCLLMEFCNGGDLHILRQRQPGKHFMEQAARFVVFCQLSL